MSFSNLISSAVDEIIAKFLHEVSTQYDMNEEDLKKIWVDMHPKVTKAPAFISNANNALDQLSKPELISHCKARGLKCTGSKAELITRLSEPENASSSKPKPKTTTPVVKSSIHKMLKSQITSVTIERNKFNNYEHSATRFVFDRATEQVIGKQNSNGNIDPLTKDDIEICNKHKFKYTLPENLNDAKANTTVIAELGDDMDEDVLEEVLEEEDEEMLDEEEEADDFEEYNEDD
jgi:hypothetical protein